MGFGVRLTHEAEADLQCLFDHAPERELAREVAREDGGDFDPAEQALAAIRAGIHTLQTSPFTGRKAGPSPFLRELIIAFGRSGCVALVEFVGSAEVVVAAVRHQRESDCQ